jgi:hypothetical protein
VKEEKPLLQLKTVFRKENVISDGVYSSEQDNGVSGKLQEVHSTLVQGVENLDMNKGPSCKDLECDEDLSEFGGGGASDGAGDLFQEKFNNLPQVPEETNSVEYQEGVKRGLEIFRRSERPRSPEMQGSQAPEESDASQKLHGNKSSETGKELTVSIPAAARPFDTPLSSRHPGEEFAFTLQAAPITSQTQNAISPPLTEDTPSENPLLHPNDHEESQGRLQRPIIEYFPHKLEPNMALCQKLFDTAEKSEVNSNMLSLLLGVRMINTFIP